jgi:hypothetical protein
MTTTTNAGEDIEKLDHSHVAGRNIKGRSPFRKEIGSFLQK